MDKREQKVRRGQLAIKYVMGGQLEVFERWRVWMQVKKDVEQSVFNFHLAPFFFQCMTFVPKV